MSWKNLTFRLQRGSSVCRVYSEILSIRMGARLVVAVMVCGIMGLGGAGGAGTDICQFVSPCKCKFEDDSLIDLTSLDTTPAYLYNVNTFDKNNDLSSWTLETYFFHPCRDVAMKFPDSTLNECQSASVCKHTTQFVKSGDNYNKTDLGYFLVGKISGSKIQGNENKLSIVYNVVKDVQVTVMLSCLKDPDSDSTLEVLKRDPKSPVLTFYSPKACAERVPEPSHHSLGTTLLIIFFVLVLVYLLTGCCVRHFMMGARGVEIIPNYSFWKELPSLVRDGIVFVQNGFKPPPQPTTSPGPNPNPNSYDSI